MIPFEADPTLYLLCAAYFVGSILFIVSGYFGKHTLGFLYPMCLLFIIFGVFVGVFVVGIIYTGSTQQIDITVCNHTTNDDYMYIVDENDQTYFIYDSTLKLKIKDGKKISASVLNEWGDSYPKIYKIDAPFVCNTSERC